MEPPLGERIRISRKDVGLTQQKLADLAGCSRGYVGNLEKGITANVGSDILVPMAKALGISEKYLLGTTDDPLDGIEDEDDDEDVKGTNDKQKGKKTGASTYTVTNPEVELLITIYQLLGAEKRKILLNMAKVLRDAETGHIIGTEPDQPTA